MKTKVEKKGIRNWDWGWRFESRVYDLILGSWGVIDGV